MAEAEWNHFFTSDWVFDELSKTLGAQVESLSFKHNRLAVLAKFLFKSLKCVVHLEQTIVFVFGRLLLFRLNSRFDLHLHNVTHHFAGRNGSTASVTTVMDHRRSNSGENEDE